MNGTGTALLETKRLILRPFTMDDAHDMYHNWANNTHVTRFLTWPVHESEADSAQILATWIKDYEDPNTYQWCIQLKKNQQAIGCIGVVHQNEEIDAVELGYCLSEECWRQGIMTEALKSVVRYLFEKAGCNRVSAKHDVNNPNSGRVMKAAGMQYEGTLLQSSKNNQGICDMSVYAITRDFFLQSEKQQEHSG